MYVHIYTHTYIHIYIYTYTHTYTYMLMLQGTKSPSHKKGQKFLVTNIYFKPLLLKDTFESEQPTA